MIKFYNKNVIVEGPDLSGKSTFIKELHKKSNYRFNLIDRSYLSRVCYARQFGRDVAKERRGLERELNDLNNKIIVLLPSKYLLLDRYKKRGDDIQNEKSLLELYEIFVDEVSKIANMSNVIIFDNGIVCDDLELLVTTSCMLLDKFENSSIKDISKNIIGAVLADKKYEKILNLEVEVDPSYDTESFVSINRNEIYYYKDIEDDCVKIIQNEMNGKNSYRVPQEYSSSRRFYYSSDKCMSSIHFVHRNDRLSVISTLRSTDVINNSESDLDFLIYLSSKINKNFQWKTDKIDVIVRFNSAHLRSDTKDEYE